MVKFRLKEEHIKLISELNFRTATIVDSADRYRPAIDLKRPFGNSGATTNVCEIMGWHSNEDGEYAERDIKRAEMLLVELPVALEIVVRKQTFEPGEYEVCEYGAYFNYKHMKNYHILKVALDEIEKQYNGSDQMDNLHNLCMNVSGDNPWKIIADLQWFTQTDFTRYAISVFQKHYDDYLLDDWFEKHDGEDYCKHCPENDECPHGMTCYGGEPIEPPCYGVDLKEFLCVDDILEEIKENLHEQE